jgi:murein tripeptide amidase MpaA
MTQLIISAPHDSGNIDVLDAGNAADIRLALRKDTAADFSQWFYFRVVGGSDRALSFTIEGLDGTSYVRGWENYNVAASYDLEHWFRVDSRFDGKALAFDHKPDRNSCYYAYFAAYPVERYRRFVAGIAASPLAAQIPLGTSIDGEPLDLLRFGDPAADRQLWIIARQHPGESMGSWWMEGFLPRLADTDDAAATALRQQAAIYVVPLVNLDGVRRGHLRTNTAGADLNREWADPSPERSPEVFNIRGKMDELGCNFFLDVHGDEIIENNFIAGAEGVPSWSPDRQKELDGFKSALAARSPAFQTVEGYPVDAPGQANLKIATNAIAERFGCLAMTLEMPFKDAKVLPDRQTGWSPGRCRDLGRACLDAIWATQRR